MTYNTNKRERIEKMLNLIENEIDEYIKSSRTITSSSIKDYKGSYDNGEVHTFGKGGYIEELVDQLKNLPYLKENSNAHSNNSEKQLLNFLENDGWVSYKGLEDVISAKSYHDVKQTFGKVTKQLLFNVYKYDVLHGKYSESLSPYKVIKHPNGKNNSPDFLIIDEERSEVLELELKSAKNPSELFVGDNPPKANCLYFLSTKTTNSFFWGHEVLSGTVNIAHIDALKQTTRIMKKLFKIVNIEFGNMGSNFTSHIRNQYKLKVLDYLGKNVNKYHCDKGAFKVIT